MCTDLKCREVYYEISPSALWTINSICGYASTNIDNPDSTVWHCEYASTNIDNPDSTVWHLRSFCHGSAVPSEFFFEETGMSSDAEIFLPLHSRATKHLIECMNDISYLYIPNDSKPSLF
jgi:hypothetical protein